MDYILDCDTLDCLGQALRETYQVENQEEFPTELARLCSELELAASDGRR